MQSFCFAHLEVNDFKFKKNLYFKNRRLRISFLFSYLSSFLSIVPVTNLEVQLNKRMDSPVLTKKLRVDSSSISPGDTKKDSGPTQKEIVLALARFVCTETKRNAKGKDIQYVVRECPNREYCKNDGGLICYQNKSGYKNPHLHLRTCVAKVSFLTYLDRALTNREMTLSSLRCTTRH